MLRHHITSKKMQRPPPMISFVSPSLIVPGSSKPKIDGIVLTQMGYTIHSQQLWGDYAKDGALMPKAAVNALLLQRISARLGDAAIDPTLWPEIMEQLCVAVGSAGAALLQNDVRTSDIPRTEAVSDMFSHYFASGWHARDIRAERGAPLLLRGEQVVIDQDILSPDEMRSVGYYREAVAPFGFRSFAAVGFSAGSALWVLAIQRTVREGLFDYDEKRLLAQLSPRLTEIATLSKSVGLAVLSGVANALELIRQPALALDRMGYVLGVNASADNFFDDEVRVPNRRLGAYPLLVEQAA